MNYNLFSDFILIYYYKAMHVVIKNDQWTIKNCEALIEAGAILIQQLAFCWLSAFSIFLLASLLWFPFPSEEFRGGKILNCADHILKWAFQ